MNFLAHIYLSGDDDEIMIGNFIGDFVKGRKFEEYAPKISLGIQLHRAIDTFTDAHEIVKKSKARIRPFYGKYAGVTIDMFYDYFLATKWSQYHSLPLDKFSQKVYQTLQNQKTVLPLEVQQFLPYMIHQDWLGRYTSFQGLQQSLKGIDRRTNFKAGISDAIVYLKKFFRDFEKDYEFFFPEIQFFTKNFIEKNNFF
ncbi:MAG: acyl carrier protein phosphodiesterase [Flammeovirgaceae bacterium]